MSTATGVTVKQVVARPPAGRWELVKGELRMMSPAGGEHGWVIVNVTAPLAAFVKQHRLGYVLGAETGFIIHRDPDSVRAPDVAYVRRDRFQGGLPQGFIDGAPDIAIEVLSPSDTASAVEEKTEDWLTGGCGEVWLIDPRRRSASVCTQVDGAVVRRSVTQFVSERLPGFELPVEQLFER
jgi:Uma2 family endonuclease